LEGIFHEQLRQFTMNEEDLAAYLYQANEGLKTQEERLAALFTERARCNEGMERVYDLYMGSQISAEGFGSRYKPLEERLKQLNDEIPRLQAEIDYVKIAFLSRDEILRGAQNLHEKWPTLAQDERRQVTEAVVEKITVADGEVSIEMCHLPTSLNDDKMGAKPFNLAPWKRAFFASSTAI
jgi:site-specific DNA recombinase